MTGIFYGLRDQTFIYAIKNILLKGLTKSAVDDMVDSNLDLFNSVFTSKSANPLNNYEMFEQFGDLTINKFIVNYMYEKFPQLKNPGGVDVVAKLRIKYASKEQLYIISYEKCNFWPFITSTADERERKRKSLSEDVFEAFIGLSEKILDEKYTVGVGYHIMQIILSSIFDEVNISLKYENLVDAKTRLNELSAEQKDRVGKIIYRHSHDNFMQETTIIRDFQNNMEVIAVAKASIKKDSQEKAAEIAIRYLQNKYGIIKEPPPRFVEFR